MYYLINFENNSTQHIFTNSFNRSLCKWGKYDTSTAGVSVEFEDMKELFAFYRKELKKKRVCAQCKEILEISELQETSLNGIRNA